MQQKLEENNKFLTWEEATARGVESRKSRWSRAGRWAALAAGLVLAVLLGMNAPKRFDRIPTEETTESAADLTLPQEGPTFSSETAAAGTEDKAETLPELEIEYDPVMDAGNLKAFDTLEAFEAYEKGREDGMTFYYLPKVAEEQFRLALISKREGVYFATGYQVLGEISVPEAASSYAKEMLQTLSCTQYLYSEPDGTLKQLGSGCQEILYGGKTVYYREEWEQRGEDSVFLGYSFVFAADETAIYMHVPPVGSLEEALVFTDVEKHIIE